MQEFLLQNLEPRALDRLDIRFERSTLGSLDLIDRGGGFVFDRQLTPGFENRGEGGVIDHPQHGRVFEFTGKYHFKSDKLLDLVGKSFRLSISFVTNQEPQVIVQTGNYPSPPDPIRQGFTINANQFTGNQAFQFFHLVAPTTYQRTYWPLANQGQLVHLEYICDMKAKKTICLDKSTSAKNEYPLITFTGFEEFYIGASYGKKTPFLGLLKYLTIEPF